MNLLTTPAPRAADVAIVGLGCRFPEACNVEQFWLNLREGRESVRRVEREDLVAAGVPAAELDLTDYVPVVAATGEIDRFDARFFSYTPKEAAHTDPQIRLFLEVAHTALENAGYDPYGIDGTVAVYASAGTNRYVDMYLGNGRDASSSSSMAVSALNNTDYVASTVAYKLNLTGAAITLSTACSSSLVGLHLACQAIRNGECDLAVVGGVDVEYPVGHGYVWDDGGPVSRSGHVRPFSAQADGTVFSSGAGAVVVKGLAEAEADGDHIWGVIRGSAVNNDGGAKAGFTAPSILGQAAMLTEALAMAGVAPDQIDYVEAHATGTILGDPVELAALEKAFRALSDDDLDPGTCGLGSVKGNVGHLGHAAGIASLIKVALCLDRGELAPSINAELVNEHIDLDRCPFRLIDELTPWARTAERPRIAGVSSFGIGGTNAHVVLAEAPEAASRRRADVAAVPAEPQILPWSGRSAEAADAYTGKLAHHLAWRGPQLGLNAVSGTLQVSRTRHPHRRALVADDLGAAVVALESGAELVSGSGKPVDLLFAFPGQGAQHAQMGLALNGVLPAFTAAMAECFALFAEQKIDVRTAWREADDARLTDTALAQPLLFAVEVALARQWSAWGVRPQAVCAHSVGEVSALTVAGILGLEDAVTLLAARVQACVAAPPGRMLAVALAPEHLGSLPVGVHLAVVNGSRQCVLAGDPGAVDRIATAYAEQGTASRLLATSRAFHTPLMAGAAEEFALMVEDLPFAPPQIPMYSAAVGGLLDDAQATEPRFWADQLAAPVRFDRLMEALGEGPRQVLEVGPGRTLTSLLRGRPASRSWDQLTSLPGAADGGSASWHLTDTLARLWVAGRSVDWAAFRGTRSFGRVPLPPYPYQRNRHWVDPTPAAPGEESPPASAAGASPERQQPAQPSQTPVAGSSEAARSPAPAPTPFSRLVWRADPVPVGASSGVESSAVTAGVAVVLAPEDADRRRSVVRAVQQAGWRPVLVQAPGRKRIDGFTHPARVTSATDLQRVLDEIAALGSEVDLVVHALGLDGGNESDTGPDRWHGSGQNNHHDDQDGLAQSVIALVQAAARRPRLPRLVVLASGSVDVSGSETVRPGAAMLHGLLRSVAAEHPELGGRLVDVGPFTPDGVLADELRGSEPTGVVALRGASTWRRHEVPLALPDAAVPAVRDGGVYLLTGAFGGLGREVARGLAGTGRSPCLVLVGRHLPGEDDPYVEELIALGAQVRMVSADISDRRAVRRAFDVATTVYGVVDGVFHLAGVAGDGLVAFRSPEDIAAVFAPKMAGTDALASECTARSISRFVVFSSRAAVDGLVGSADYAAANAYADAVTLDLHRRSGQAALSIGWPSWSEVGMAVDRDERPRPWVVEVDESWPLVDEHRISGVAVMPGTGHLDLVVRAARDRLGWPEGTSLDLHDIVYEAVLAVRSAQRVEVWFTPSGQQWRFEVWSRPAVAGGGGTRHVSGRIAAYAGPAELRAVAALRSRFPTAQPDADAKTVRLFTLGPRWQTVTAICIGPAVGEKLVELALPEAYAVECSQHALHPTLLDSATATARDPDEPPHLPFLIERLVVHADLPSEFLSHIRRTRSSDGLIVADVDLVDLDGRLLVQATGYTMRLVTDTAFVAGEPSAPNADDPDSGIPPRVAVQHLLALLPLADRVSHVLIRPHRGGRPVPLVASPSAATGAPVTTEPTPVSPRVPLRPVPVPSAPTPLGAPAIAGSPDPSSDEHAVVTGITEIWVDAIGSETIGVDEDFFELGGNSLTAIGLMGQVRSRFGIEMSIAALFDHPTIARLAAAVVGQLQEQP